MPDTTISAVGLRVVKVLVGNLPRTTAEIVEATGVTRTAVNGQLNELVAAGFVQRTKETLEGRGRPRYRYRANHNALLLLFPSNQHLVVPAIWQTIDETGGPDLTKQIVQGVSRILAEHYNAKITATTPKQRLEQLIEVLREEGGLLDIAESNGQVVFRKRTCPFITMVDEKQTICAVDADMLSGIVGRPVRRVTSRHEGDPCCTFEVAVGE